MMSLNVHMFILRLFMNEEKILEILTLLFALLNAMIRYRCSPKTNSKVSKFKFHVNKKNVPTSLICSDRLQHPCLALIQGSGFIYRFLIGI